MPSNPFRQLWGAGYGAALISVTKPGCTLSARSAIRLDDRGKAPGQLNGNGVWVGWNWRGHVTTPADLERWHAAGANVGLRTGAFPLVDGDIDDPDLAATVLARVVAALGPAPRRWREGAARWGLLYRAPEPFRKIKLSWQRNGVAEKVELLGDGEQAAIGGIHPSGARTRWDALVPAAQLPTLTKAAVLACFAELETWLPSVGAIDLKLEITGEGSRAVLSEGRAPEEIRAAATKMLLAIPCAEIDRDLWLVCTTAVKRWVGGDSAFYAGVYFDWSAQYAENDEAAIEKMWNGVRDVSVGHDRLPDLARRLGGYDGPGSAVIDFCPLPISEFLITPVDALEADDSWIKTYCYVVSVERYVDLRTMQMLSESALKRLYWRHGHPADSRNNAAMIWQQHPDARKLATITYRPGCERFVWEEGASGGQQECLNTWRAPALELPDSVTDADVSPWLEHAEYMLPLSLERGMLLNWVAYRVQNLDRKANFAMILGGEEGIGKNLLLAPLRHALGGRNVKGVDQSDVDGQWTDWAGNCLLVVIEEIHHFGQSTINKIKKYITVPPDTVRINIKGIPQYEVPNAAAFLAYTNNKDALQLGLGDRRWLVLWSNAEPRDDAYYRALAGWLEVGGSAKVVRWLLQRDLSAFNAAGRAPDTDAKEEMRSLAAHVVERWVSGAVRDRLPPFDTDLITVETVLGSLPRHLDKHGATDKRVIAGIKAAGALLLGQVRLNSGEDAGSRTRLWALRDTARYADRPLAGLVPVYREQQKRGVVMRAKSDFDDTISAPDDLLN